MKSNQKELVIYSDLHIGAPTEIKEKIICTKNTIFLGDNFDLKNTLKNNLNEIEKLRLETIQNCRKVGGIYISGNHSLESIKSNFYQIRESVLFLHGDVIDAGIGRANIWRKIFRKGKSKLYWLLLREYRKYFSGETSSFKKRYFERAYNLAKINKCHTIVMGHFHPKKLIDLNYNGVRIIFVPRGKSKIKLFKI